MTPYEAYFICKGKINKKLEPYFIKDPYWAYLYARNVIKEKLPENMHNAMLIHANHYAKLYFNFIKNNPRP